MNFLKNEKSCSVKRSMMCALLAATMLFGAFAGGCKDKTQDAVVDTHDTAVVSSSVASSESASSSSSSKSSSSAAASSKSASSTASKNSSSAASSKADKASDKDTSKKTSSVEASSAEKVESEAPENNSKNEDSSKEDASKSATGYKAGQTVTAVISFGNIEMNGQPAKIGAYDYTITYNADVLEFEKEEQQASSDLKVVNSNEPGIIKIAHIAALGFDEDYTGEKKPTYKITFKVTKDTDDLGISGECPSLTAVSMDGKDTLPLVGKNDPDDKYSELTIE